MKKVELRIAERKLNENKEHMAFLRQINKEDRDRKDVLEKEVTAKSEELTLLKSRLDATLLKEKHLEEQVKIS